MYRHEAMLEVAEITRRGSRVGILHVVVNEAAVIVGDSKRRMTQTLYECGR